MHAQYQGLFRLNFKKRLDQSWVGLFRKEITLLLIKKLTIGSIFDKTIIATLIFDILYDLKCQ